MQAPRLSDLHEQDAATSLDQDATFHWQCAEWQKEVHCFKRSEHIISTSNLVSPNIQK